MNDAAGVTGPTPLPFITGHLPGVGGEIKVEPTDFRVEEIPLYEPSGDGEHIYVGLTRQGWNTRDLVRRVAEVTGVKAREIGAAGLKDKHALTSQTLSLWLPQDDPTAVGEKIAAALDVQVDFAVRHRNKLKRGHLLGNRFEVVIRDLEVSDAEAGSRIGSVKSALLAGGLPNFYGPQRFGVAGDNAERGRGILVDGDRYPAWQRRFYLSAYQSELFNRWLVERIVMGAFDRLMAGDLAKKTDTGGMFEVEDLAAEAPRFEDREITYTGPIYGSKMRWPAADARQLEEAVLEAAEVTPDMLKRQKLSGTRRVGCLFLDEIAAEVDDGAARFAFELPKGAYATVLLREFTKTNLGAAEPEDD